MPVERVSKTFKDISLSLQTNPLNSDLVTLSNETAIARSLRNLVYTLPGEVFFNARLGSDITQSLFENMTDLSAVTIQEQIKNTIVRYEPRVDLIAVDVVPDYDNAEYNVSIRYYIIGIEAQPQQLNFALQSVR